MRGCCLTQHLTIWSNDMTKTLIAAAFAATTLAAISAPASAHEKHHFFDHGPRLHLFIGGGGGCGYYLDRWEDTGSFYWKRKYYICKGWW
jgi:hypothetical protein